MDFNFFSHCFFTFSIHNPSFLLTHLKLVWPLIRMFSVSFLPPLTLAEWACLAQPHLWSQSAYHISCTCAQTAKGSDKAVQKISNAWRYHSGLLLCSLSLDNLASYLLETRKAIRREGAPVGCQCYTLAPWHLPLSLPCCYTLPCFCG